jgi:PAS domain S-box-containing protein
MSGSQILVVEDEAIVATAIKNELLQFGYAVPDIASTAAEAIAKAVQKKPELVLMDIHLKGAQDGIEAAREIRSRCEIPVVYLTAFADPDTVARAGATEAFGYLLKPYEERELQTTIEMGLAKHRAEQRRAETHRLLSAILVEGIDDAVVASDPANQICFMNIAGEALTGWCRDDVIGAPVAAVCNLMENGKRLLLERLTERAFSEGRTVALPAATRLVTRNGQQTAIAGCLTPIHDCRGKSVGAVLKLRNNCAGLEFEREDATPVQPSKPSGFRPTILLAEADPMVQDFARLILQEHNYRVLVADDGIQAVEIFRQAAERIDLVIVDLGIPRVTADAILERLLELDPNVEVLFSSSYFAEDRPDGGSHPLGVISKPYRRQELVDRVQRALAPCLDLNPRK